MIDSLKILRERTKVSMSECKRVLTLCNGNVEEAAQVLLNTGRVKKLDALLDSREGIVRAFVTPDGVGRIIEVNCQTDFAARSGVFETFVNDVLNSTMIFHNLPIGPVNTTTGVQLDEQISCKRKYELKTSMRDSHVWHYNHHNNKISVLVEYSIFGKDPRMMIGLKMLTDIIENVAMQVAATKPMVVRTQELSQNIIDKQRLIFENQLREDSKPKPESSWPKIIDGKFKKWYSDVVLLNQESLLFPKKTVEQVLTEESKKLDDDLNIVIQSFIRYELGE